MVTFKVDTYTMKVSKFSSKVVIRTFYFLICLILLMIYKTFMTVYDLQVNIINYFANLMFVLLGTRKNIPKIISILVSVNIKISSKNRTLSLLS